MCCFRLINSFLDAKIAELILVLKKIIKKFGIEILEIIKNSRNM